MSDKSEVLLRNSSILSDKLISKINTFLDYEENSKVRIVAISSEERLKARICAVLESETDYLVEGFSTSQSEVELDNLILADYIVIHTAAIRMAPLILTNILKLVRNFNKKAFVIVDKWNMLPQTRENLEKVRKSAIEEFSMVNVVGIFNVGEKLDLDFISVEEIVKRISISIENDFLQTRKQQIDKVYNYYLDVIEQEYIDVKGKANDVREKIERYITNVSGFHRANIVKIKNVSSELNMYSKDLYDKWRLISAEECIGENECNGDEELRKHIQEEYVNRVMIEYKELTTVIINNYKEKLVTFRENLLNEMYQIKDKIEGLPYIDSNFLEEFEINIEELKSVDIIMKEINELLDDNTEKLGKKVKIISCKVFNEETLGEKLNKKLEEIAEKFIYDEGKESSQKKLKTEVAIRKYYSNVLEMCNIKLFSEVDVFVEILKKNINNKAEKMLDTYYVRLEKNLLRIETAVEKEYIVV